QSLVADSPRLIAGSHVLHRLLMPRHPPYALKNLNTQNDHNKSQTNNQEPKRLSIIRQRCSRPLCSSQKTTGPTKPHPPTRKTGTWSRSPEAPDTHSARSLRTQQRAHQTTHPNPPFPLPQPGAVLAEPHKQPDE